MEFFSTGLAICGGHDDIDVLHKDCFYRPILSTEPNAVAMQTQMLETRYMSLWVDLGWKVWVVGGRETFAVSGRKWTK